MSRKLLTKYILSKYHKYRRQLIYPNPETYRQSLTRIMLIAVAFFAVLMHIGVTLYEITTRDFSNHLFRLIPVLTSIALVLLYNRYRLVRRASVHIIIITLFLFNATEAVYGYPLLRIYLPLIAVACIAPILLRPLSAGLYAIISITIVIINASHGNTAVGDVVVSIVVLLFVGTFISFISQTTRSAFKSNEIFTNKLISLYDNDKRLFSSLAHRLKTPLTILQTEFRLFESRFPAQKRSEINRQIQEINNTINELTKVSRVNLSAISSKSQEVDLVQLTKKVHRDGEILAKNYIRSFNKERSVELQIPDTLTQALTRGNFEQLKEALLNLVDNSINHSPDKHKVKVVISLKEAPGYFLIKISDNGQGIRSEKLKDILSMRSAATNHKGYQHIGLEITRNIIESHSGIFDIYSPEAGGTTVEIMLPSHN